jgi:GAF domain-containing protein
MNYFRSLLPSNVPANINQEDELRVWQERTLQYLLIGFSLISAIISLLMIQSSTSTGDWTLFISFIALATTSILLFLLRNVSYWVRSIAALIVFYIIATVIFIRSGWGGVALLMLISFSFLSTIFLYYKPSRIGLGLSIGTLLFWAVLRSTSLVPGIVESANMVSLIIDIVLVLFIGAVGNFAISTLKKKFIDEHSRFSRSEILNIELKNQLETQKQDLEKRVFQLRTASEITQTASTIFESQVLLQKVADLVRDRFDLYYIGIFLLDDAKEYAVLRYGTGDAGRRMLAAKHKLAVGGYSMIGWATQTKKSRIALDVGEEAVHFDNPLLPETRSELALPIVSGDTVYGAMTIQSRAVNAFDENDVLILQSVADSLAVALENAASFQKSQKALEDIRVLNRAYIKQAWWDTLDLNRDLKFDFENPEAVEVPENPNIIQVPLILRDEVIGKINLEFDGSDITKETREFLETISSQTTVALENARLIEETQLAALQEQQLNALTAQFSRAVTIEEILKTAVTEFGKLPSVSEASIALIPPEENENRELKPFTSKEVK